MKTTNPSNTTQLHQRRFASKPAGIKMKTGKAVLLLTLLPLLADAQSLVSYGPNANYVSATTTFSRTGTRKLTGGTYTYLDAFSDTSVLSPTSGYTGPAFYGGYTYSVTGASGVPSALSQQSVYNSDRNTTNDDIDLQSYYSTGWSGATLSFASVFVFQLSNTSSITNLSATVSNNTANAFKTNAAWRWLVKTSGSYYVSQATFSDANFFTPTSFTLSNLSSTKWALYTPGTDLNFDQTAATFSSIDTSDVTAAGLYVENDSWNGDSNTIGFDVAIESFAANGVAVPEPRNVSLFLLGSLLVLGMAARKRVRLSC